MSRVPPLCALALLCAALGAGCGKKDDPEPAGGGGSPGGSNPGGQPLLGTRTDADKREAAHRLRQIGLALHNFESANGTFPAGVIGPKGQLGLSWRVAILPYLETSEKADALYKEFKLNEPWDSEHNKKLVNRMPKVFEAPNAALSYGKTYLRSFSGPQAFIPSGPANALWADQAPGLVARGRRVADFTDGLSNTLMVVEATEAVEWTKPDDLVFLDPPSGPSNKGPTGSPPKLGFPGEGGFHGLLSDGAVRFVRDTTADKTLPGLVTINGGEVISE